MFDYRYFRFTKSKFVKFVDDGQNGTIDSNVFKRYGCSMIQYRVKCRTYTITPVAFKSFLDYFHSLKVELYCFNYKI